MAEVEMPAVAAVASARPVSRAWHDLVSGIASGVSVVIAGHPLDTIKVRLQTQPAPKLGEAPQFKGVMDCAAKTVRTEGVLGLFKGMLSPLLGVPPIYAVVFGVYGSTKRLLGETIDTPLEIRRVALAGAITGFSTVLLSAPGEGIKARLQVQYSSDKGAARYTGPLDCAKKMYRAGGLREVFKGSLVTAFRDVPGNAIYFSMYEVLKRSFIPTGGTARDVGPLPMMLSGGLAGIVTWLVILPIDTIKSRVQIDLTGKYAHGYRGLVQAYREIVTEAGGFHGLYRGIAPALLRSFPANAACFLGYEMCLRLLHYFDST